MTTAHNLDFEVAEYESFTSIDDGFMRFRVGTCEGLWRATDSSCKRDRKDFKILEVWNNSLRRHLIEKRKFKSSGKDDVIKKWKFI